MDAVFKSCGVKRPLVVICDDEPSMRESLSDLLASVNLNVEAFSSAREMLQFPLLKDADCLILDVRLPALSGLQLQQELVQGLLNKQVAGRLGLAEVTVKSHRKQVMSKMGVRTLPDLVRSAEELRLHPARPGIMGEPPMPEQRFRRRSW